MSTRHSIPSTIKKATAEDILRIRDIHIPIERNDTGGTDSQVTYEVKMGEAVAFDGEKPLAIANPDDPAAFQMLVNIYTQSMAKDRTSDRFRLEHNGVAFRAQRKETVNGPMLVLRALPEILPYLHELNLPAFWPQLLRSNQLLSGGLVLFTGAAGQGKTTTASSTIGTRLKDNAGVAWTFEDPAEMPLDGWHGAGCCYQTEVGLSVGERSATLDGELGAEFSNVIMESLRLYPATHGGGNMAFIGEIRDGGTAVAAMTAASTGYLVIATIHGDSIPAALSRLINYAERVIDGQAARQQLADALRLCVHQRLTWDTNKEGWDAGTISGRIMYVPSDKELGEDNPNNRLAKAIADGSRSQIETIVKHQNNALNQLKTAAANSEKKIKPEDVPLSAITKALINITL